MPIDFPCNCGKLLRVPDGYESRQVRCPVCSAINTVPANAPKITIPAAPLITQPTPIPQPAPAPRFNLNPQPLPTSTKNSTLLLNPNLAYSTNPTRGLRGFLYLLLALAFIPLIWTTFQKKESLEDQLTRTVAAHTELPDLADHLNNLRNSDGIIPIDDKFFAALPNDKLDGALLSYNTELHWLMALASAFAFFAFYMIAFRGAINHAGGMALAGIFTGTLGILLLLGFQWAAFNMPLFQINGAIGLVLFIVKMIGLSYSLAEGNTGFFLSFLGFTAGVGLCEEVTKVLPLLLKVKPTPGSPPPTWYSLLLWGLASGTGFGIAEGIMYSHKYYNGIEGPSIYLVRFLSCVVLHAMWAGANGINLYRKRNSLYNSANNWEYFGRVILIVLVPMILHGLYDTLLKQEHDGFALLVALATFLWLAFQIERAYRSEPSPALSTTQPF